MNSFHLMENQSSNMRFRTNFFWRFVYRVICERKILSFLACTAEPDASSVWFPHYSKTKPIILYFEHFWVFYFILTTFYNFWFELITWWAILTSRFSSSIILLLNPLLGWHIHRPQLRHPIYRYELDGYMPVEMERNKHILKPIC